MFKKLFPTLSLVAKLTLAGFAMTYFVCSSCSSSLRSYITISVFNATIWIALWIGNARVSEYASRFFPWTEQPAKRLFFGLVSTLGYTLVVVYLLTVMFRQLTNVNIDFQRDVAYVTMGITFAISAFMHGQVFLRNWRQAALDVETFKKESAIAKYESLKNQINPHFLFNSLNALTNLVYEDQDKAAKFIKQLSEVYRYVLDSREKEVVTLKEELGFVRSYLFLQQIRFGNNLKVNVELEGVDGTIAPLALQLLVENAIKHNVISSDDPLSINIYLKEGFICVENNLQKKAAIPESGSGLGLENIRSRYKFLSDKDVSVADTDGKFLVRLPLLNVDEA